MGKFDGLFTTTTTKTAAPPTATQAKSTKQTKKKDKFADLFEPTNPTVPKSQPGTPNYEAETKRIQTDQLAKTHPFNPKNPNNQLNAELPTQSLGANFKSSLVPSIKEVASLTAGKKSLPAMVGKQVYDQYANPSEMERELEKQTVANPKYDVPILKQAGIAVLRTLTPVVEGFGTIVGKDILAQQELADETINAKPRITGKTVETGVPDELITHKITAEEATDVFMNSVNVGLAIAPLIVKGVKGGSVKLADTISKNSKVPITYADMQKITSATSEAEAISRVGKTKYNAFQEATQTNAVRKSLRQGYIELAEKEPNVFANILRNSATRPITEIKNFAKPYGKPVYVPNVGLLPERITPAEAATTEAAILEKHYVPKIEGKTMSYELKIINDHNTAVEAFKKNPNEANLNKVSKLANERFKTKDELLPSREKQLALPEKGTPSTTTQGEGFVMTAKPDKRMVEVMKTINDYKTAVKKFTAKPTATSLARVKKTKVAMDKAKGILKSTPNEAFKAEIVKEKVIPKTPAPAPKPAKFDPSALSEKATNSLLNNPQNKFKKPNRFDGEGYSLKEAETGLAENQKDLPNRIVLGKNDAGDVILKDGTHLLEAYREKGLAIPERKIKLEDGVTTADLDKSQGKTPSKIAKSIEAKAIEQGLTKGFDGVAGYDKINIKEQAQKAADLMADPKEALAVIRGEKPLPNGLRGGALIKAAETYIKQTGDTQMAYELANSPLASETSAAAQELRLAAERDPDSATARLQELRKIREEKTEKQVPKKTREVLKTAKKETEKVNLSKEDLQWEKFLKDIQC